VKPFVLTQINTERANEEMRALIPKNESINGETKNNLKKIQMNAIERRRTFSNPKAKSPTNQKTEKLVVNHRSESLLNLETAKTKAILDKSILTTFETFYKQLDKLEKDFETLGNNTPSNVKQSFQNMKAYLVANYSNHESVIVKKKERWWTKLWNWVQDV
jgi:hypothetical protein